MKDLAFTCMNSSVREHVLGREMRPTSINGEFVIISNEIGGIFAEGVFHFLGRVRQYVCNRRSTIISAGRISLMPERAQEEDHISILLGCHSSSCW